MYCYLKPRKLVCYVFNLNVAPFLECADVYGASEYGMVVCFESLIVSIDRILEEVAHKLWL
jgi:hypothetical protein